MKVCNISMSFCPIRGGQEVYIENLIKVLKKHGVESSVLQPKTECTKKNVFFVPRIPKKFLEKFIVNFPWFAFNIGLLLSKKILRSHDVIICHYAFHYPSIKWHKKVIILSHGVLWGIPPRSYFDKYHKKASLLAKTNGAFIVSNDTNFLRELGFSIKPGTGFFTEVFKNVWVVPNCVDINYFSRNPIILKEKVVLVPRNIRRDRGIHLAIEAFGIFHKQFPDFRLEIIGKGNQNDEYFNYCKELASQLKLNDKIKFVGHTEQTEMPHHYNKAMLTLIPSTEKEGTSLSALESMSCGTATITTNIGGLQDLPAVKSEPNSNDIAQKLLSTLNNAEKIAIEQQNEVRAKFNLDLWENAWIKIIKSINGQPEL